MVLQRTFNPREAGSIPVTPTNGVNMKVSVVSDEDLKRLVAEAHSYRSLLLSLGRKYTGGSFAHIKRHVEGLGIDTSHFLGKRSMVGKVSHRRKSPKEILILRRSGDRTHAHLLRRALIESGVPHLCSKCGQEPFWLGKPLTLDVDHINENWLDDRISNLRFLCPNCHSQFSRNLL